MRHIVVFGAAALCVLGLSVGAMAQWSDDFESYAPGTKMDNVNGWAGWDNVGTAAGTISDANSLSGTNSISCSNTLGNDSVHPFSGYSSGAWIFTAHQYIPSNLDALTYFILNNEYNHGGPWDWGVEMHMDPTTGMANESIHDPDGNLAVPIVFDQWVEIRTLIDLDNNYMEAYYNNQMIASGDWNIRTGGLIELQNVDLYAPHNETVYFDDLSLTLVPEPASLLLLSLGLLAIRRR